MVGHPLNNVFKEFKTSLVSYWIMLKGKLLLAKDFELNSLIFLSQI